MQLNKISSVVLCIVDSEVSCSCVCVSLVELRRKTIPIFFDMMQCEYMSVLPGLQQKKRNFDKVGKLSCYLLLLLLLLRS